MSHLSDHCYIYIQFMQAQVINKRVGGVLEKQARESHRSFLKPQKLLPELQAYNYNTLNNYLGKSKIAYDNISDDNATKLLEVLKDFGMGGLCFEKEDFLQPGYVSQIGYPPLRIDILNTIDGIVFEEAFAGMQTRQLEDDLNINFIGLADL